MVLLKIDLGWTRRIEAEGVETEEEHETLLRLDVRMGPGSLFARPAPLDLTG